MLLNIEEIIDIYFRGQRFKGVVIQQLPDSKYEVIYESLDMPNVGKYIRNQIEYTTELWKVINPSTKIANSDTYAIFIQKLKNLY